MIRGSSRDASQDGPSAAATLERGVAPKSPASVDVGVERPRLDRLRSASVPETRIARRQSAHRRGGIRGLKLRVPEMIRLLHLLALAIVTVVCAGFTTHVGGFARLAAPTEVRARSSANAGWSAPASQSSHRWRDGGGRPVINRDAVEADLDDDDLDDDRHTRSDRSDERALAVRCAWPPRKPGRALRGEPQIDATRFVIGRGLLRGPPT